MATLSSILAWEIPRTEEPGGLQAMQSQRVPYNLAAEHSSTISTSTSSFFFFLFLFFNL